MVTSAFLLKAQLVLDQNYKPAKGDEFEVHWYNDRPTSSNIAQNGESFSWNLSMLQYTTTPDIHKGIGAINARAYQHFTLSRVVMDRGDGYYYYYKHNKTHFSQDGFSRGYTETVNNVTRRAVYSLKFSDKLYLLKYPFTYGDSLESTRRYYLPEKFESDDKLVVDTVYGVRTRKTKAVGYGTMMLTGNQIFTVLKVEVEETSADTTVIEGDTTIRNFTFRWFDFWTEGYAEPLVTAYDYAENYSIRILDLNNSSRIVSINTPLTENVNLYPNPAKDHFTIENQAISSAKIYNSASKELAFLKATNGVFDVAGLPTGAYYLALFNKDGEIKGHSKLIISN